MVAGKGGDGGGLEGLLRGLKLSEEERQGVRGVWRAGGREEASSVLQAVGSGEIVRREDGQCRWYCVGTRRIWCPKDGIRCKDLGDNLFLFSFLQPGGKRRAIMEGPWEFGGDLLIVVDFDATKRLKELEFVHVPVWTRVDDLPFGLMNEETSKLIGNKVGEFLEVDAEEDGSAAGRFLRIKMLLDVRKPLARGVLVEDAENSRELWCGILYEFLPNFCYCCGRLGHIDRECDFLVEKGSAKQYGDWMRVTPEKKRPSGDYRSSRWSGGSSSGGNSSQRRSEGRWKPAEKDKSKLSNSSLVQQQALDPELRDDGQSPLKTVEGGGGGGKPRKLTFEGQDEEEDAALAVVHVNIPHQSSNCGGKDTQEQDHQPAVLAAGHVEGISVSTDNTMQSGDKEEVKGNTSMEVDENEDRERTVGTQAHHGLVSQVEKEPMAQKTNEERRGKVLQEHEMLPKLSSVPRRKGRDTYKRRPRQAPAQASVQPDGPENKRRMLPEEGEGAKKMKMDVVHDGVMWEMVVADDGKNFVQVEVGLQGRSRGTQ